MPCTYYTPEEEAQIAREAINKLTRLLCEACRIIEAGYTPDMSKELAAWWESHQKMDAERKKAEKAERERKELKRKALKKLSKTDLRALGLKD